MKKIRLMVTTLAILSTAQIYAQRSTETEANDTAWEQALAVVREEALNGKPYVPFAARPTDIPQADIPAFPGAEGGGMYTFGGRGGRVLAVTNLNDSGEGSFRWACEQGGARIIVFNVAGIIRLQSAVEINAPYVTIAGQTAPGDGVCIAGETVAINTHDVIIRHMRFRRGATDRTRRDDCLGGHPVGNIIIDHCSVSWGLDENISLYRHMYDPGDGSPRRKTGTVNLTIQNTISSQALNTYNHAFGSTLGGENASFMRNLWANNTARNPSVGWNGVFNFVNNVVYNWVHRSADGGDYTALYNFINNYYKPGPMTRTDNPVAFRILKPESGRSKLPYKQYGRVYADGNIMYGNDRVTRDNWDGGIQVEDRPDAGEYTPYMKWNEPHPMPYLTIVPAREAYDFVLANVGATLPRRDIVDERMVDQVRTGRVYYDPEYERTLPPEAERRRGWDSYKQGILTDIAQVGGYPEYRGTPYKDSDSDGMPDEWERRYGLDPNDPSDANGDLNGDGYTNIEKYINGIDPLKKVDWRNRDNNYDTLAAKGSLI